MSAKTILVADDSVDDEYFLRQILETAGFNHQVIAVRDGDEAIAYLTGAGAYKDRDEFPLPDVFMVDLKMPNRNGFEVMEWLRSQPQLSNLLVVALTDSRSPQDITRAYRSGARSFISKPCTTQDLVNLASAYPQFWMAVSALVLAQ